jgi:hypothetical protein
LPREEIDVNDYYQPHFKVEILLVGVWHPIAWFVVLEDANLFCSWLNEKFPRETYRVSDV